MTVIFLKLMNNGHFGGVFKKRSFWLVTVILVEISVILVIQRSFWWWTNGHFGYKFNDGDYQNDRYFPKWPLFGTKMTVIFYQNDRCMAKMTVIFMTKMTVSSSPKWPLYDQNDRYFGPKWPLPKWPLLAKMTVIHHQNDRYFKTRPKWPLFIKFK